MFCIMASAGPWIRQMKGEARRQERDIYAHWWEQQEQIIFKIKTNFSNLVYIIRSA
jgi:hypothetical protein